MRKSMKLMLTGLVLAASLTACSQTPDAGNTDGAAASAKPVTFEFWYGFPSSFATSFEKLVSDFNASHPNIKVVPVNNGDYKNNATKLQAALLAGQQPAVTLLQMSQIGQFGDSLQDLNTYFPKEKLTKFNEALLKNSYVNNKLVGIPFNRSVSLLFYNKDLLNKAGIAEAPKTWDELHASALKLTDKANNVYGFATAADMVFLENMIYSQDGSVLSEDNKTVTLNSEAAVTSVKLLQDMVKDGSARIPTGEKGNAMIQLSNDFSSGKVAMLPMSSAAMASILQNSKGKMNVGVAPMPVGKKRAIPANGSNVVMFAKAPAPQKAAAAEFIQWITDKESMAFLSKETGYVPVTKDSVETETIRQLWKEVPAFRIPYDELQFAHPRPTMKSYSEMSIKIEDAVTKALLDVSIKPEQAVQDAAAQVKTILDTIK